MIILDKHELIIEEEDDGTRLDTVLSLNMADFSRNYLQKLIEKGSVLINDSVQTSKKYKVKTNDYIIINIPEAEELQIEAENIPLEIIYEDNDLIVVNKPKGMVVHPAPGNYSGTMVNALLYHCDNLSTINGVIRPGIVHRIDKDTSGLLVVTKNNKAHYSLANQLKEHSVNRVYHAITYGNIKQDEGTIDLPIGRHPVNRLKMAVTHQNSKKAVTHYQVIERFGNFTYIKVKLETGRTHQIRVHMAYIQHPLLGDIVYGPKKPKYKIEGQLLHAKVLGFDHPSTKKYLEFDSPLPTHFTNAMDRIKR